MTNAEIIAKIRAEIERLKNHAISSRTEFIHIGYTENAFAEDSRITVYDHLLSFLANIEKSLPINSELRDTRRTEEAYQEVAKEMRKQIKDGEVLEEEMDKFFETMPVLEHENIFEETFKNIARHFAEWGYLRAAEKYDELEYNRQREEESVPNDLGEAAEKHASMHPLFNGKPAKNSFIAGAKWQKEQYLFFNKAWAENMQAELDRNYENGKQAMKEQLMKEAVEYEVGMHGEPITITFDKYVQRARGIFPRDKVRIIIVKED